MSASARSLSSCFISAIIFAGSKDDYECNMIKVLKRLQILAELHYEKYNELMDYYNAVEPNGNCASVLANPLYPFPPLFVSTAQICADGGLDESGCDLGNLEDSARQVEAINDELDNTGCVGIY